MASGPSTCGVHSGHSYKTLVLGWDADLDVAVLAICCSRDFTALRWKPAEREVGTQVVAVGFPRSTEGRLTATTGETVAHDTISRQHGFIPHSAPLNPGNSGGPLFASGTSSSSVGGINQACSRLKALIGIAITSILASAPPQLTPRSTVYTEKAIAETVSLRTGGTAPRPSFRGKKPLKTPACGPYGV